MTKTDRPPQDASVCPKCETEYPQPAPSECDFCGVPLVTAAAPTLPHQVD